MNQTAAALVIGSEILTGKIRESNVNLLAKELFRLGIELRRVVVCPDEIDTIAGDVDWLRRRHDWLITSGGVGPTHDDVTIKAVAQAFGRSVIESAELQDRIRAFVGERYNEGHLRMSRIPEGAQLLVTDEVPWPTVLIENVFVLPGLPKVFQMKMQVLRQHLASDVTFTTRALYTTRRETELVGELDRLADENPEVAIGSYPVWGNERYRVKLTVDGVDSDRVEQVVARLRECLSDDEIVGED